MSFCETKSVSSRPFRKPVNCLCHFRPQISKCPPEGATPGQKFHGTNHLARLPRFQVPGLSGSKVILLRKKTKNFPFFSLSLGSKKLRFVHKTELASEGMWKALNLAGKMRRSSFQHNVLMLTYIIFYVNRNRFPEFSHFFINNFRHSTQLSSLFIPAKRHMNATESSSLPFDFHVHIGLFQLALRAI